MGMFNFINSNKENYFICSNNYFGVEQLNTLNLKGKSVKRALKGNSKKVFKKNINTETDFGLLHKRSKSKNNIFLIRSFIWFKFRSHNKRVIRKKFLVRKKRQIVSEKIFLTKGKFSVRKALYYPYLSGRVSKILYSNRLSLFTRWVIRYRPAKFLKIYRRIMKRNLKSLKRFGVFKKKIKRLGRFRHKRLRFVNRKLILMGLNKKIDYTLKNNYIRSNIKKNKNKAFKKVYFYLLKKFIAKSNLVDKEYVLKNKFSLFRGVSSSSVSKCFQLKKKN